MPSSITRKKRSTSASPTLHVPVSTPRETGAAPIFSVALPKDTASVCIVRPWRYRDVPQLAWFDRVEMNKGYASSALDEDCDSTNAAYRYVAETLDESHWRTQSDGRCVPTTYAIELQQHQDGDVVSEQVIGSIDAGVLLREDSAWHVSAELTYFLHQSYWGRGITTAVVKMFAGWVFTAFPQVNRIDGHVFVDWAPSSCRVLEKAGFQKIESAKQVAWKNGLGYTDHAGWELLRDMWVAKGSVAPPA